jgi:hypothetical protein
MKLCKLLACVIGLCKLRLGASCGRVAAGLAAREGKELLRLRAKRTDPRE